MAEYIGCRECDSPYCKGCNLKNLETMLRNGKFNCIMNENRCINTTADVAPVVHSYWESYDCSQYMGTDEYGEPKWRDGKFYVCHNRRCRRKTVVKSHYCPNCGAKMDECNEPEN